MEQEPPYSTPLQHGIHWSGKRGYLDFFNEQCNMVMVIATCHVWCSTLLLEWIWWRVRSSTKRDDSTLDLWNQHAGNALQSNLNYREAKTLKEKQRYSLLPVLRHLLSSRPNWFKVCKVKHYQYPGTFHFPNPQCLGYVEDVTKLPFYSPEGEHFFFDDIQLGKAKPRELRCVTYCVDGMEEELNYQITPCGGVKFCSVEGCSYTISSRECRSCSDHPDQLLKLSEACPVEFVYVWRKNSEDKRRWQIGLVRSGDLNSENLHHHHLNAASKILSWVVHDIYNDKDPSWKTHDIVTGK